MGPKSHWSRWECCWGFRWHKKNTFPVPEWTCCTLPHSFTTFRVVQQTSKEMLHGDKDRLTLGLIEEQIGSCHSSSRKKRQRRHSSDWKNIQKFTCTVSGCWCTEEPRFYIAAPQSCKLQQFFRKFLLKNNFFLFKYGSLFPDYMIILRGGCFPWVFPHFPCLLINILFI